MDVRALLASAPAQLRHSTAQPDVTYALAKDLIATHGADGSISIDAADAADELPASGAAAIGPVYRPLEGGAVAVPTGRALVRFGDDDEAESHRDEIAGAGFDLEQSLSYAPQAAWVRASSGRIADTLNRLAQLELLPGVQHVEPQLISEAARRAEPL